MHPNDQEKIAFVTKRGTFYYNPTEAKYVLAELHEGECGKN